MDPKTRGIIAYLTIIGWVIALVTNSPKDEQSTFHIRQMLGLIILSVASSLIAVIPILGWLVAIIGTFGAFILWIIGFLSALEGTCKPVPFLGEKFQEWFKNI